MEDCYYQGVSYFVMRVSYIVVPIGRHILIQPSALEEII